MDSGKEHFQILLIIKTTALLSIMYDVCLTCHETTSHVTYTKMADWCVPLITGERTGLIILIIIFLRLNGIFNLSSPPGLNLMEWGQSQMSVSKTEKNCCEWLVDLKKIVHLFHAQRWMARGRGRFWLSQDWPEEQSYNEPNTKKVMCLSTLYFYLALYAIYASFWQ